MDEKFNEATTLRPLGDRTMDAQLVTIDIPKLIEQIKNEKSWENGQRNAITVFKTNGLRIVLIALRKNAEMAEHTAEGLISLQVLEGKIQFNTGEKSDQLSMRQMLALHKGIPHSIRAIEETILLLTLTTTLAGKE